MLSSDVSLSVSLSEKPSFDVSLSVALQLGAESDPPRAELSQGECRTALRFLAAAAGGLAVGGGGGDFMDEFAAVSRDAAALADAGPPSGGEGALRMRAVRRCRLTSG